MADLHLELAAYLDAAARGFVLGEHDCCTFMAGWLMRLGLPDVMADRRGAYADDRAFRRLLMAEGGLVAACHRRFTGAGLEVRPAARAGDVAVVMLPWARRAGERRWRPSGAIALSARHFVTLGRSHLFFAGTMPVAKIWAVPHG